MSFVRRSPWSAIFLGGLIAGACDITYAITFVYFYRGVAPQRLLQSVASGVLGKNAFTGGNGSAALGLLLHFLIAFVWAAAFVLLASRLAALMRRPILSGAIYGVFIFFFMNLVVLPLSAVPGPIVFRFWPTFTGLLVHAFLIGVPIALAARRAESEAGVQPH